ncbi:hypothetical protein PCH_Pc18g06260 [Penicillium rubens Wisconsin 54-1255]|uniref:Uncharacterized protein n=1 Tax=Penicillium rubens (strain ATCC 28089 / DSM 1075 / NRRL 1951 / Wisconsin 54-1255) TaxID=500485 RepID=B6HCM2_PENRW|nr:hypothetical protein PCH_Pc18g06260 [Penicillium rubens Wisconsin 54-1255]
MTGASAEIFCCDDALRPWMAFHCNTGQVRAQGGSSTGPPQPEDNSLQDETGGKDTLWRMFDELITESRKLAGKETKYSKEKKEKPESTTNRPSAPREITTSINRHYGRDDWRIFCNCAWT